MDKALLDLFLKLSNEERLDYVNKKIEFMEIEKDFMKKDEEARSAVSKVREASQNFMAITNLMGANRTRVTTSVLDEQKVSALHRMNKEIGEAIDFSENFSFLFNRYKEAEEVFQTYEKQLYDKHEITPHTMIQFVGVDFANLHGETVMGGATLNNRVLRAAPQATFGQVTEIQAARAFAEPARLAGLDDQRPF
jgi:hypothetical protein